MRKLMLSIPVTVVILLAASMAQGPPPRLTLSPAIRASRRLRSGSGLR